MKKAIVTGANGFVGKALVNLLLEKNIEVIAVVREMNSDLNFHINNKNLKIVKCDLEKIASLKEKTTDRDIDVFYNFAWVGSSGDVRGDYKVQLDNAKYACDVVKTANDMNCKKFVFAGSIMEQECIKLIKMDKSSGLGNIYSTGKIAADFMGKILCDGLEIEYVSTVISNIFGPGEFSPRLINTTIRKLLNGDKTTFTSGEQNYDFIFIDDAVEAFYCIGEKGKAGNYYIGSKNPRPLKEFLMELRDCIDENIELGLGEVEFNGISIDYNKEFDINKLEKDTGHVNKIEFVEGINKTIEWIKELNK